MAFTANLCRMNSKTPILLSYAFRPFFLLNGIFAILIIFTWIMSLHGHGLPITTPLWHSHEMLIGFAMATVAGFSLTAVANWTGRPAIQGSPLAWLLFSWLLGRLAMLLIAWLPAELVFSLDMIFPIMLTYLLGSEVFAGRSKRNYQLVGILLVVVLLNALYHLGSMQVVANGERLATYLLIHTLVVLVTVIAGRIVPAFTGNWLRSQGQTSMPVNNALLNHATVLISIVVGLAASFMPYHPITGVLAFIAALIHAYRLSRWKAFATISNPLLFVLHAAYLWLPIAYILLGCAVFGWVFGPTAALHALTMGAISSMVLAVTTRVALGHTGRPLEAARATVMAYWILMIAVVLRVLGPLTGSSYMLMIDLSAAGWMLAFGIFTWVYWPILARAKVD
jgi:uncharacterized protein involved in response to NO